LDADADGIESRRSKRITAITELDFYSQHLEEASRYAAVAEEAAMRLARVNAASGQVNQIRNHAKHISNAAKTARTNIVGRVFNTSLNKIWRDLFVRLAPSEQFVPAFRLPEGKEAPVEAILETVHRSGVRGGSPNAILSHANLNTAALTLFLALHLFVNSRFPWLILDDPVQSMDDVHISQFAAFLRTLSKSMGRQIIMTVHDRALFDYLTLELSPAFPNDSLITIEISRNFSGDTVATPKAFTYTPDKAIAA
jgi:exonuclease SbcC